MMGTLLTFDVAVPTAVAADAGRNHRSGSHHLRHKAVQAIRLLTRNAQQGKGRQLGPLDTPVDVHVQQRCTTRHRRDPDNVSGPGKAILDELVAVGRLPDDSWRHGTEAYRKPDLDKLIRSTLDGLADGGMLPGDDQRV